MAVTLPPPPPAPAHALGREMDALSDAVDEVNHFLGTHPGAAYDPADERSWLSQKSKFDADKANKAAFRDYENACERVKGFYREQHAKQTVEYNAWAREHYLGTTTFELTMWEAMEKLNELVDDSDPDTAMPQIQHLLQCAEAARRDGRPDWFVLTCALHDLGKLLVFKGAPQWSVVGDTFVVGCRPEPGYIYPEYFKANPDFQPGSRYNTEHGIYRPGCGLSSLTFSFGHDEFLAQKAQRYTRLPEAAINMIRYHSAYILHRQGGLTQFFAPGDEARVEHCRAMNAYDLYTKDEAPVDVDAVKGYYLGLIDKYVVGGRDAKIPW